MIQYVATKVQFHTKLIKKEKKKKRRTSRTEIHFHIQGRCSGQDFNYSMFSKNQHYLMAVIITVVGVKKNSTLTSADDSINPPPEKKKRA